MKARLLPSAIKFDSRDVNRPLALGAELAWAGPGAENGVPTISIGLPVYNGARFLSQAIHSILDQTFADFELIISDNASTDATQQICTDFQHGDDRIRYFRQPINVGAPRNWNFVVEQARGRFFKWASANDYCDREILAKCAEVLERDPGVVLCYGRTCLVGDSGESLGVYPSDLTVTDERPSDRFKRVARELGLNNAQAGLIRLDVLKRTPLERPYPAGDLVLMAELSLFGFFWLLPEVLLYRRVGKESFSRLLTKDELRRFVDPQATSRTRLTAWRTHWDYLSAVARAPIPPGEKVRGILVAARHAYWDWKDLWQEARTMLPRLRKT